MKRVIAALAVVTVSGLLAVSSAIATETITYTYDSKGRLVATDSSGSVNDNQSTDIDYDPTGNRTGYTASDGIASASLAIANASVTEGGTLSFTVTRSGNTSITVSVEFSTASGSATSGSDFTAASGTVNFAADDTSETITVNTTDDATVESSETMTVVLSNPGSNTTITDDSGTGTINDNDVAPANLAIGNSTKTEGQTLSFTVTRSGNTSISASASYATSNQTAVAPGDYTAKSGTVSFSSGQTSKTITVTTIDDSTTESTETMKVTLSNPSSNTNITTAIGTGTINDNDAPIQITNGSFTVLSAHQSTYSCNTTSGGGGGYSYTYTTCTVISSGNTAYAFSNVNGSVTEYFAPGYSLNSGLWVSPSYYGTP